MNIKSRIFSAILLILCSPFVISTNSSAAINADKAQSLSDHLLKQFQAMGSFQANYLGAKQGSVLRLNIIYASRNKYALLEFFSSDRSAQPDFILMLDYRDEPVYTYISVADRNAFRLSFKDLLEYKSHPLGVLLAALQRSAATQGMPLQLDGKKVVPSINIELESESLGFGLGMSNTGLQVSWLGKDRLQEAQEVRESGSEVTIVYSSKHAVRIDTKNGLLLEDKWTTSDKAERKISLANLKKLAKETPPDKYLSQYKKIPISNVVTGEILDKLYVYFLTSVADSLNQQKDLDAYLQAHGDEIRRSAREISENYWLRVRIDELQSGKKPDQQITEFIEQKMVPIYRESLKQMKQDVPFKVFVQAIKDDMRNLLLKELLDDKTTAMDVSDVATDKYIAALPDTARKPLLRLLALAEMDARMGIELAKLDFLLYYAENFYDISKNDISKQH